MEVGPSVGRLLDDTVFWERRRIFLVDKYLVFIILEQV